MWLLALIFGWVGRRPRDPITREAVDRAVQEYARQLDALTEAVEALRGSVEGRR